MRASRSQEIVKLLESRGVQLGCVIDEGGAVVNRTMFGIPSEHCHCGFGGKRPRGF